jgi:biopolymer transport protein ExbB
MVSALSPRVRSLAQRLPMTLAAAAVFCAPAFALQDAAQPESLSIWDLIVMSGFIGWVICVLSVVALAMIIENFISLKRDRLAPPELIDEVQALFEEGQFQEAMELCESEKTVFTRICAAGISKIGHWELMQKTLQEMTDEESIKLHQKIGWIATLAGVAPMLGLLGTVQGMIVAFQTIATTANPSPAELATGIYVALLTTLEGLIVAIPCIAAFAYIRNNLIRSMIEVSAIVGDLFERFRPAH